MGMGQWPTELLIDQPDPDPLELAPRCDYQWRLVEENLPGAQWSYGKEWAHGWPYPA